MSAISASLQSESGEFWSELWDKGVTGWHKDDVQETLKTHISFLRGGVPDGTCSVFVPLCGKSLDMVWLLEQGFSVTGCEISELAVQQFFTENSIPYEKRSSEHFTVYKGTNRSVELYVGDIYDCTKDSVGQFDALWDCNALVAVNPGDREKYSKTLIALVKPKGRILLTTYEYDQSLRVKFPHSVPEAIVTPLYKRECSVTLAARIDMKDTYFVTKFDLPWANRLVFYIEKNNN